MTERSSGYTTRRRFRRQKWWLQYTTAIMTTKRLMISAMVALPEVNLSFGVAVGYPTLSRLLFLPFSSSCTVCLLHTLFAEFYFPMICFSDGLQAHSKSDFLITQAIWQWKAQAQSITLSSLDASSHLLFQDLTSSFPAPKLHSLPSRVSHTLPAPRDCPRRPSPSPGR